MQGLQQLVDRCADDFISLYHHDWVPDEAGAEHAYQYGEAILKNLRDFETGLRAELRRRIATRLRQRNTCVPVSQLPPELLQLIFRFNLTTSSGNRARRYVRTMIILRSVSWGWRAVLDSSPFLWGHITSLDHPEFISTALENSKEAPLRLKWSRRERDGSQSAFLDKMFPHLHRWESIAIHNPTNEVFAKYFTSRAPLLKRMALCESGEWEPHDLAYPFSGSLTFLEELHIRRWPDIGWREAQFGQLRVLDIGYCQSLGTSLIFRLIQENQRLETLRLEDITFTSSTSLTHSNIPVVLSHLKDLTLSHLRLAEPNKFDIHALHPTLYILRHIRFPSCTKFTIRTSIEYESTVDPEDLRSLLPSPLDVLAHPSPNDPQTSQTTRGYLSATFSDHGLALTVDEEPGCEFKYQVKLEDTPRSITRRWLKSALEDRPGVTLRRFKLHVSIYHDSQMDDLVAFQASEAVTLLSVDIDANDLQEELERRLLQILATPCTSASGTTVIAFPGLLGVEFVGWQGRGEAVLEMIRNRFSTPGVEAHRPDLIIIQTRHRYKELLWDSLGEIRELLAFNAIHFGAIDSSPSRLTRLRSPEFWWPLSDDAKDESLDISEDESNSNWVAESEEGSGVDWGEE